ncbi:MAG: NAD(P)/FAD-dependent oxidoreductase [Ferruginibacter sp.]|nr:NAD(P)/FAD-dependent oxidoreductase [Ferruginibacter sp.]
MKEYDSIIIGSGAGGLTAALCLARAGQKVAVIEQHYVPGGWCHSFYIDGHRFSPGVHYIGLVDKEQSTSKLYEGLGIANDLFFFRMNPKGYEHCWIGEEKIDMPAGIDNLYESLSARFPKEKKGLKKYLALVKNVSREIHLIPKMSGFWDNILIPYRTRHLGKYGLFSLKRIVNWHVKDPLLQSILNVQCGDHGLSPSKVSFPYHCAMMDHYFEGGFYPMGGGAAIVKAMTNNIKKNKGEIKTGVGVKQILLSDKNEKNKYKAIGVELQNGEKLFGKNIISNTDPTATFNMIDKAYLSQKLQKKLQNAKYSITSLSFFMVVDMDVKAAGLDSGNVWKMPNIAMDEVYNNLSVDYILEQNEFASLFINCSSLKDPSSYDGVHHILEVITFIDYDSFIIKCKTKDDYKKIKEKLCEIFVQSMEKLIPNISNKIVALELGTPTTNDFYLQATKGNTYGTNKSFMQTGPFSFTAKTEIENLYMCGASIMSHGVAGASYSGLKTAAIILKCKEEDMLIADETQQVQILEAEDSTNWPDWLLQKIAIKKRRATFNQQQKQA